MTIEELKRNYTLNRLGWGYRPAVDDYVTALEADLSKVNNFRESLRAKFQKKCDDFQELQAECERLRAQNKNLLLEQAHEESVRGELHGKLEAAGQHLKMLQDLNESRSA